MSGLDQSSYDVLERHRRGTRGRYGSRSFPRYEPAKVSSSVRVFVMAYAGVWAVATLAWAPYGRRKSAAEGRNPLCLCGF